MSNPGNISGVEQPSGGGGAAGGPPAPDKADAGAMTGSFRMDSLSPGAADGAGEPHSGSRRSKVSMTSLFLAVLLIGGGGILFVMRKIGIGPMSALAQFKMPDYDVTKAPAAKTKDHERIIQDLTASHISSQVPADQVQKNPFRMADALRPTSAEDPVEPTAKGDDGAAAKLALEERQRRDADARKKMVDSALASMTVHQIMGGSNPIARIDDEVVRIGDTVAELFTVKAISGRSVELECDGATYAISMDDRQAPAKKSAPSGPKPGKKK